MKRWKATVVVTYTQDMEVDAETQADAKATMLDWFDPIRCLNTAEQQITNVKEVEREAQ